MTPRNTNTGGVLEAMILPALERGGYAYKKQVKIGLRHGGGTHRIDAVATKDSQTILVSMKWQALTPTHGRETAPCTPVKRTRARRPSSQRAL